ncbi:hypothetical protein BCR34DRAFT_363672 [Clohesyomyces aquaticus]|uniref:Zn(2)-C6 fungal-type domain-containing protein n=1 Tax=Clohesyomyces aquaticus TaxID=1231657 RepID=A0A1Y1ZI43_9PLEO|nr:hypothetical protein BCR34DRAFT_363672 [Clohesyomyces aquaticus]
MAANRGSRATSRKAAAPQAQKKTSAKVQKTSTTKASKGGKLTLKLRCLKSIPAPDPTPTSDEDDSSVPTKRIQVKAACLSCRRRKIGCDGARPTCGRCASKNTTCQYDVRENESRAEMYVRQINDAHAQIVDLQDTVTELQQQVAEMKKEAQDQTELANHALEQLRDGENAFADIRELARTSGGVAALRVLVRSEKSFPVFIQQILALDTEAEKKMAKGMKGRTNALAVAAQELAGLEN